MKWILIKEIIGGPSDFGIGWIIILLAAVLGIVAGIIESSRWLWRKFKEKDRYLGLVSRLDTGTHISYLIELLGTPVFRGTTPEGEEYIFVNKYFYVQVYAAANGSVSLFSVTTRRKDFNPTLHSQFGSAIVTLGKTYFSEIANPKRHFTSGDHGATTFYSESEYLGYDGGYRMFFFSSNPNGFKPLYMFPDYTMTAELENSDRLKAFRARTVINTYTVSTLSGPNGDSQLQTPYFGPRFYQVRVHRK